MTADPNTNGLGSEEPGVEGSDAKAAAIVVNPAALKAHREAFRAAVANAMDKLDTSPLDDAAYFEANPEEDCRARLPLPGERPIDPGCYVLVKRNYGVAGRLPIWWLADNARDFASPEGTWTDQPWPQRSLL